LSGGLAASSAGKSTGDSKMADQNRCAAEIIKPMSKNKNRGSDFRDFLDEEGILVEVENPRLDAGDKPAIQPTAGKATLAKAETTNDQFSWPAGRVPRLRITVNRRAASCFFSSLY
jgi:hypothetical protein